MSHSADIGTMSAQASSTLPSRLFLSTGGIVFGMALYSFLAYGLSAGRFGQGISLVAITCSKLAAVYVYFGIALLAGNSRYITLVVGCLAASALGLTLVPPRLHFLTAVEWVMFLCGGGVLGFLIANGKSGLHAFMAGLFAVMLGSLLWIVPQFNQLQAAITAFGEESIENIKRFGVGFEGDKPTEAMLEQMRRAVEFIGRILPGMLALSFVTQYSAGALIFLSVKETQSMRGGLLAPFSRWQIPFQVMALLPVAVAASFLLHGWQKMVGENLLLVLSVFYCVAGLSVVAYYLERIKMSRVGKVMIYILMIPTGFLGYLALALAGVLDSFFDWRGLSRSEEKLANRVE